MGVNEHPCEFLPLRLAVDAFVDSGKFPHHQSLETALREKLCVFQLKNNVFFLGNVVFEH